MLTLLIDADSGLVVMIGRRAPGSRHECEARAESGAEVAVGRTTATAGRGVPSPARVSGLLTEHQLRCCQP